MKKNNLLYTLLIALMGISTICAASDEFSTGNKRLDKRIDEISDRVIKRYEQQSTDIAEQLKRIRQQSFDRKEEIASLRFDMEEQEKIWEEEDEKYRAEKQKKENREGRLTVFGAVYFSTLFACTVGTGIYGIVECLKLIPRGT